MERVLVVGSKPESLVNFRGPLLKAMVYEGYELFAAAGGRDLDTEVSLEAMGVAYCPIRLCRTGVNPFADLITLFSLIQLMRRLKPDLVLNYTIKPVIFGGLASKICRVKKVYSLITGLGYVFGDTKSGRKHIAGLVAKFLYWLSLPVSQKVFFQNPDDKRLFVEMGLVAKDKNIVVDGSGVDLNFFSFTEPHQINMPLSEAFKFLLIARLLKDKGICEYAEAAQIIKRKYPQAEFHLVGPYDLNPLGLKQEQICRWKDQEVVKFHGEQSDVRPFIRDCSVYVLPSYREGTPRTVLEAMATGRAIITTDAPGCRETIKQPADKNSDSLRVGLNGILVPVKNVEALVTAMDFFLKNPKQAEIMGRESRLYAQERYDVCKVNRVMLRQMGLGAV